MINEKVNKNDNKSLFSKIFLGNKRPNKEKKLKSADPPTENRPKVQRERKRRQPKIILSTETLIEIEKWAERARRGTAKHTFGDILVQIQEHNESLDDAIHSLTLAQIMPYNEMIRLIKLQEISPISNSEFITNLSKRYSTSRENVFERIHHVKQLEEYVAANKENYQNDVDQDFVQK